MGRMTRAKAAELSGSIRADEDLQPGQARDTNNKLPTIAEDERMPLGEIASNRTGTTDRLNEDASVTRPSKTKKTAGRKGGKSGSKKTVDGLDASASDVPTREPIISPDENDLPPSPASENASDELMKVVPELDVSNMPTYDIKQASPSSNAVRLTRNLLRDTSPNPSIGKTTRVAELSDQLAIFASSINESLEPTECDFEEPTESLEPLTESIVAPQLGNSTNYTQSTDILSPNNNSTTKRQSGDDISFNIALQGTDGTLKNMPGESMTPYDELEAAAIEAQTPPRSSRSSSATTAPTSVSDTASDHCNSLTGDSPTSIRSKRSAPVIRTTKASQARIELAHGPKDRVQAPALGRPTVANRVASSSSVDGIDASEPVEKKEVIIPHSKPRPMSMAFPAPPPPPKSTKAPTQSNFQLPGEAIAAKLKAAKEARLQKDAEDQGKKAFKARPIPASVVKGAAVRQTSTSRAREILIAGPKSGGVVIAPVTPADPRASSVTTSRSTSRNPTSREPTVAAAPMAKPSSRPSTAMASRSTAASSASRSRTPSVTSTRPASTVPGAAAATAQRSSGTAKGKEVWHRTAFALEAVEREKKEKEDAARKARAEAAERGRLASREWAEKQKVRKMVAQMEANTSPARPVEAV